MKYLTIFTFISLTVGLVSAQEWDEIPEQELQMTSFEQDPEADAVILFDIASLKITKDFDMIIKRHKRIKILTEEGKEHADVSFYYWDDDHLLELEAHAYSPDGNETELDDELIQIQKEDEWNRCYFVIPGVQAGSVIEYHYELYRDNITFLRPWYFQSNIFTQISQLTVSLQPGFSYDAIPENISLYEYEFDSEEFFEIETKKKNKRFTWRVKNVPPFISEKYMYNQDDYYAKIYFQLNSYKDQYQDYTFIKTWKDLSEKVLDAFSECVEMDRGLEDHTLNLIRDCTDNEQKINRIYYFVRDSIETADDYDLWAFKKPDEVLKKRAGLPSCKNLLFLNMLTHAGIEAHPVMISTRSHGRLILGTPQLQQFNHFVVQVKNGTELKYMDCSDKICPKGVLSLDCDVGIGLLVLKEKGEMIKINQEMIRNKVVIKTTIDVGQKNDLLIGSEFTMEGYPALEDLSEINSGELKKFASEKLQDTFEHFEIDSIWMIEQDDPLSLKYHIKYRVTDFFSEAGEIIYMPQPMLSRLNSNPLVLEKRNYPVDFSYILDHTEVVKINLPENLQISEVPLRIKDNSRYASFSSFCFKGKNSVELNRKFTLKKISFRPSEYKELRRIYDTMTNSDQNQIVLTKL